jgi:hypothetical protein
MRTTLNIDDDVLRAVKELARLQGRTAGAVLSGLVREALRPTASPAAVRNGVPLLVPLDGAPIVTPGAIQALVDRPHERDG